MIFVDSSALIALFVASDTNHKEAEKIFPLLVEQELVTSYEIVTETLNWISKKFHSTMTHKIGSLLINEPFMTLLESTSEDRLKALDCLKQYSDQKLSFTDCISFALIHKMKIKSILSLDSDFHLLKGVTNLFVSI